MTRKPRGAEADAVYSLLGIKLDGYDAQADASISYDIRQPQYSPDLDGDDPVFKFVTRLTIKGTATYPQNRTGNQFAITVYGDDTPSLGVLATAKDVQVRTLNGVPQYREYRGRQLPVFKPPEGFGLMDKVRGEPMWTARLNLAPRIVTDMLTLLGQQRALYLAIQERKVKRLTWVHSIALQTTDPAEE